MRNRKSILLAAVLLAAVLMTKQSVQAELISIMEQEITSGQTGIPEQPVTSELLTASVQSEMEREVSSQKDIPDYFFTMYCLSDGYGHFTEVDDETWNELQNNEQQNNAQQNTAQSSATSYTPESVFTTDEETVAYIRSNLKARNESIIFSVNCPILYEPASTYRERVSEWLGDSMSKWYELALTHDPFGKGDEGDYIRWQLRGYSIKISFSGGTASYQMEIAGYYSTHDEEAAVTTKLASVYSELGLSSLTDYQKITKIHDYIVRSCDYISEGGTTGFEQYSAYGALITKKAVCQGYAVLFYRMCLENGIDCRVVTGEANGGPHAWSIVKLGGYYYNMDVTFDDPIGYSNPDGTKYYFLKSNADFNSAAAHWRDEEYDTTEFNTQYPMAPSSCTSDPGYKTEPNPEDIAADTARGNFIKRMYQTTLNRLPDQTGYDYWMGGLKAGSLTGAQLAENFVFSDELLSKNLDDDAFLTVMYHAFFDREPDQEGWDYWKGKIATGLSRKYILNGFVQAAEYQKLCKDCGIQMGSVTMKSRDNNPLLTAYLARCYTKALGRAYEEEGMDYWYDEIASGRQDAKMVAVSFIRFPEFQNKGLTEDLYLKVLYATFFGRELDESGYNYWIGQLANGVTRDDVLLSFANSEEFAGIMASFGLRTKTLLSGSELDYVLNHNTMKFHTPECRFVRTIRPEHREDFHGSREAITEMGFGPCLVCHP